MECRENILPATLWFHARFHITLTLLRPDTISGQSLMHPGVLAQPCSAPLSGVGWRPWQRLLIISVLAMRRCPALPPGADAGAPEPSARSLKSREPEL